MKGGRPTENPTTRWWLLLDVIGYKGPVALQCFNIKRPAAGD
jgi:hypothetical protein